MTFVVASNNRKKVREISAILSSIGYSAVTAEEAGVRCEPAETASTFLGNAVIKAEAFGKLTSLPVIADDSGLMVEALGGLPGVKTARYAGENADDEANIQKLLKELEGVRQAERTAWFVSVIAAVFPDGSVLSASGYTRGYIGYEKRGENGFGYDPVFYIKGNRSFAEITAEQKSSISHRGRAIRKFVFKLRDVRRMKGKI